MSKLSEKQTEALTERLNMLKNSWTWQKLTENERAAFLDRIRLESEFGSICGTTKQVETIVNALYSMFLYGAGYSGAGWREQATSSTAKLNLAIDNIEKELENVKKLFTNK